jgi:hypothetical protein
MDYVYTLKGNQSERDAIDFMAGILMSEFCGAAEHEAQAKGFRRMFAQTDEQIQDRLNQMHDNSPGEYAYKGTDKQGLSVYTFWGKTSYNKRGHTNGKFCKDGQGS